MAKRKIAGKTEILEQLTDVLRGDDESVKTSEMMKAAELIGKHLGMFGDKGGHDGGMKVVIVDDIAG
jgi:hypothetical protein